MLNTLNDCTDSQQKDALISTACRDLSGCPRHLQSFSLVTGKAPNSSGNSWTAYLRSILGEFQKEMKWQTVGDITGTVLLEGVYMQPTWRERDMPRKLPRKMTLLMPVCIDFPVSFLSLRVLPLLPHPSFLIRVILVILNGN